MKAVKAVKEEWGKRMKRVGERRKKQKEMYGRKGKRREGKEEVGVEEKGRGVEVQ